MSSTDLKLLIHTFIFSCLDYYNSLYVCLSQAALNRLQLVPNAAARLLPRTSCRSHITPVLASLHWLPIISRINYKILLITYMALSDLAPGYFFWFLIPFRSSNLSLLFIPRSNCKTKGDRAFAVLAPTLWNHLPQSHHICLSYHICQISDLF